MKMFFSREIRAAIEFAAQGGQALHVWNPPRNAKGECAWPGDKPVPLCFRQRTAWGHLLDQNEDRLEFTARKLGVIRVCFHDELTPKQHVDLCGMPLGRAVVLCEKAGE
jgi:hypothetical protein